VTLAADEKKETVATTFFEEKKTFGKLFFLAP
jgi:hypothetical protein